jgi:hypothetical protein
MTKVLQSNRNAGILRVGRLSSMQGVSLGATVA